MARILVGHPDDDLARGGMLGDYVLHLAQEDVEPSRDEIMSSSRDRQPRPTTLANRWEHTVPMCAPLVDAAPVLQ